MKTIRNERQYQKALKQFEHRWACRRRSPRCRFRDYKRLDQVAQRIGTYEKRTSTLYTQPKLLNRKKKVSLRGREK